VMTELSLDGNPVRIDLEPDTPRASCR